MLTFGNDIDSNEVKLMEKKQTGVKLPTFSVLMSVYKNEHPNFLDAALLSVEQQTLQPNQIVLVEDGPLTKELDEVIMQHKKQFPQLYEVVKKSQNEGLGLALKIGTDYCKHPWIMRMDSDDIAAPQRFEIQMNIVAQDDKYAIVGGQVDEFEGQVSNVVGHRLVPETEEEILKFVKWRNPFNHPTVLIKKEALDAVGGYQPFGKLEDYYLWVRMISAGYPVLNSPDTLVHMRVDSGMYCRRGDKENLKYILKLRRMLRKKGLINYSEQLLGNVVMLGNNLVPELFREFIYKNILHK